MPLLRPKPATAIASLAGQCGGSSSHLAAEMATGVATWCATANTAPGFRSREPWPASRPQWAVHFFAPSETSGYPPLMFTNRLRIFLTAVCSVSVLLLAGGCWPDTNPPDGMASTCYPNGQPNGKCEESENYWNCPKDCPACSAIQVIKSDNVTNPAAALGPSSKLNGSATLGPNSTLILWMGGGIWTGEDDSSPSSWDLQFKPVNDTDVMAAAYIVSILDMDSPNATYQSLGYWFKDPYSQINDQFDLKRAKIKKSDSYLIRIQGQATSKAQLLDAVIVRPDRCRTKQN